MIFFLPVHTIKVFLPLVIQQSENISSPFQRQHNRTYEDEESKRCQDEEQVDEARLKAQEAVSGGVAIYRCIVDALKRCFCLFVRAQERRYREAILRDASQVTTPSRSRMKPQHKPATSGRRLHEARRPPSSQFVLNEKSFSTLNVFLGLCHD